MTDLTNTDLDVLVVGGGIVGAGVALDAVTRGLRVGLLSGGDWAEGRSSHTSTLVHGGLVALSRIGVAAVAALRRERDLLLDVTAPHLVRRVPLLVPYHHGLPERLSVGAGLSLYDAAAFSFRQPGALPGHRQLTRRAVQRLAPSLDLTSISGAAQLYEAQVDDARLTLAVVRTAIAYGTVARARCPVQRLVRDQGRVVGAELGSAGRSAVVRARCIVLATGSERSPLLPDAGSGGAPEGAPGAAPDEVSRTGPETVHLVLPRARLRVSTGLVLRTDEQAVYVVPWGRHWIVGSTAAWSEPNRLLAELNRHLVRPVPAEAVESTYAIPAALGPDSDRVPTVQTPAAGLVLVRGSGLAGYRADAERAVDVAVTQLGGLHPASVTRRVPLLGADGFPARWNQRHLLARRAGLHVLTMEHLLRRHGSQVDILIEAIREHPELGRPLPGAEDYLAVEVWYAVAHEHATQLSDVLVRRTRIARETWDGGAEAAGAVAELMAAQLGWDDREISRQISAHLAEVSQGRR